MAGAVSCLVLAFALLTALFQANTRYFFCESMGLLRADPCTAAAHHDEPPPATDELSRTPFTCCATGIFGAMPPSTSLDETRVDTAPLVAVVGLPRAIDASLRRVDLVPEPDRREARWRIPPRPARERRAQSMIFLT
jgi:hypothetical protein